MSERDVLLHELMQIPRVRAVELDERPGAYSVSIALEAKLGWFFRRQRRRWIKQQAVIKARWLLPAHVRLERVEVR